MGGPASGKTNNPFKEAWWHTSTAEGGHRRFWFDKVKIPKPEAPPPPVDQTAVMMREFARQDTDRKLRESKGRASAFLSLDAPAKPTGPRY